MKTAIFWFRNDLRIRDNEALFRAATEYELLIPVYCLDDLMMGNTSFGFRKTGARRMNFILESLRDLHQNLSSVGSGLIVKRGSPEYILKSLVEAYDVSCIVAHSLVGVEEKLLESRLTGILSPSVKLDFYPDSTLCHLDDLPFSISNLPDVFTTFRKKIEKQWAIREEYLAPAALPPFPDNIKPEAGNVPALDSLDFGRFDPQPMKVLSFVGGETNALARLNHYFFESKKLARYKKTRNQLLGKDFSSKFSPWLAQGCISPRTIYFEVRKFEKTIEENDSTYWLIFELLWRDYFQFVALKYGGKLFQPGGIRQRKPDTRTDKDLLKSWMSGNTGIPFIDANMRELKNTGYMSNRGRQNVASFLVKDVKQDWRTGAAYFEQELIDYDVASNWGNWAYVAGVGNDPQDARYFDVIWQARNYDPEGTYVKYWIPELQHLSPNKIHTPWLLPKESIEKFGLSDSPYENPVFRRSEWTL